MKELSKAARKRVDYLLNDEWVVYGDEESIDEESTKKNYSSALKNLQTAEEVHYYAMNYNWDGGEPWELLDHPLLDRGTLLMIYWLSQPGYYVRFAAQTRLRKFFGIAPPQGMPYAKWSDNVQNLSQIYLK